MLFYFRKICLKGITGCSAAGSVLDWGSRGRRFKSCHSDQENRLFRKKLAVFLHMKFRVENANLQLVLYLFFIAAKRRKQHFRLCAKSCQNQLQSRLYTINCYRNHKFDNTPNEYTVNDIYYQTLVIFFSIAG